MKPILTFGSSMLTFSALYAAPAEAAVVPNGFENTSGGVTFLGPNNNASRRYMLLIDSSQLTGLTGQTLSGLQFRIVGTAGGTPSPATDLTYDDYEIYLSPSVDPSARSTTFADNVVGTQTQVRDGALTIPANSLAPGQPGAFGQTISFDTPYLYTGGDLAIDIRHPARPGQDIGNDSVSTTTAGYGTQFAALFGTQTATTASTSGGNFSVVNIVAVPEPASFALLGLGGLMLRRRRRA